MRGGGKKVTTQQESEEPRVSNRVSGSTLIASFLKKGSKISNRRIHKPKSKTERKKIYSKLLKEKASEATSSKKSPVKLRDKNDNGDGKDSDGDMKPNKIMKRKKQKQKGKLEVDEASRLQRRTRYLLIKMKLEQNLIDAYSTEGWKGQSREKIKPEKELQRARKQILKCKLGIRDAILQLDSLSSVGSIEEEVIAPDGSVHHEHIFCAKCKLREAFPDNDILLCDGTCNRAFHQKCLDPPLETDKIPPGDQGWFCQFCVCRIEIIDAMNAHAGTFFPVDSKWQDIFKEEANLPDNADALNTEEDWPSDDSEDADYDPEKREKSCSISGMSNDDGESSSTSLSWSLDGEAFSSGSGKDGHEGDYKVNKGIDSGENSKEEILLGPRQRRAVDYRKLYNEMFGKDAPVYEPVSEDEDWGPSSKRRRKKEPDSSNPIPNLFENDEQNPNIDMTEDDKLSPEDKIRRPILRLPRDAVEKLRQAFAANELPSRSEKENLSRELGVEPEKVSKWFKNARYLALKNRKTESTKQLQDSTGFSGEGESELEAMDKKEAEANAPEETSSETSLQKSKYSLKTQNKDSTCCDQKKTDDSGSIPDNNKVCDELSDDVSLKKLLEAKRTRESKTAEEAAREHEAFEAEMERLCRAQNRLENMKQRLQRLQNLKGRKKLGKSSSLPEEDSIMYVPIAELKEKP